MKEQYLDLMEIIIGEAVRWVNDRGAVIDPVEHVEWAQTTPRFVSAAACLLYFDRLTEHKEKVFTAMSYCCGKLKLPETKQMSADFWMRELCTAYFCLQKIAPAALVGQWKRDLSQVEPENVYMFTDRTRQNLERFHNWAVYSAGGEVMRQSLGIGGGDFLWGDAFFDVYMDKQLWRMTNLGMYRDPGDPITYDITTRLQADNALVWGCRDGELRAKWQTLLNKGAETMLQYLSPAGFVPYGGRSAAFQFQEAIVAALCECHARRHKDDHPELAAVFKRQAELSTDAIRPWLAMKPFRHLKNRFDPAGKHGCDDYGKYSVYSLFAASCLGLAALYADDSIKPAAAVPAEGHGVLELNPEFHKVFARCRQNYVEIDTAADLRYDASGIGRILPRNWPFGLLPAMPFAPQNAHYQIDPSLQFCLRPYAVGPEDLAGDTGNLFQLHIHRNLPEQVEFSLVWRDFPVQVIDITATGIKIRCRSADDKLFRYQLPLLESDGEVSTQIDISDNRLRLTYGSFTGEIRVSSPLLKSELAPVNRNGVYRLYESRPVLIFELEIVTAD